MHDVIRSGACMGLVGGKYKLRIWRVMSLVKGIVRWTK